jgi:hypothetical protein
MIRWPKLLKTSSHNKFSLMFQARLLKSQVRWKKLLSLMKKLTLLKNVNQNCKRSHKPPLLQKRPLKKLRRKKSRRKKETRKRADSLESSRSQTSTWTGSRKSSTSINSKRKSKCLAWTSRGATMLKLCRKLAKKLVKTWPRTKCSKCVNMLESPKRCLKQWA